MRREKDTLSPEIRERIRALGVGRGFESAEGKAEKSLPLDTNAGPPYSEIVWAFLKSGTWEQRLIKWLIIVILIGLAWRILTGSAMFGTGKSKTAEPLPPTYSYPNF